MQFKLLVIPDEPIPKKYNSAELYYSGYSDNDNNGFLINDIKSIEKKDSFYELLCDAEILGDFSISDIRNIFKTSINNNILYIDYKKEILINIIDLQFEI